MYVYIHVHTAHACSLIRNFPSPVVKGYSITYRLRTIATYHRTDRSGLWSSQQYRWCRWRPSGTLRHTVQRQDRRSCTQSPGRLLKFNIGSWYTVHCILYVHVTCTVRACTTVRVCALVCTLHICTMGSVCMSRVNTIVYRYMYYPDELLQILIFDEL